MTISEHTKLINYIIGFCFNSQIDSLKKYDVVLIEQTLCNEDGKQVVPDVIIKSNKFSNIIAFECKSGSTLKIDQVERYSKLTAKDVLRWVHMPSGNVSLDVCITGFIKNHEMLKSSNIKKFPLILFDLENKKIIKSSNNFHNIEIEKNFSSEIDIDNKHLPLSYYPFSVDDDEKSMYPYIIRMIVSVIRDSKSHNDPLDDPQSYININCFKKIHQFWDVISNSHRRRLESKILKIIKKLFNNEELKSKIQLYQNNNNDQTLNTILQILNKKYDPSPTLDDY